MEPEDKDKSATIPPAETRTVGKRKPGLWRRYPGWETYVFDPMVLAPMTDAEMIAEGWV